MMRLAIASVVLLSGCATPGAWFRAGSTEQEFNADKYQCLSGAHQSVPPAMAATPGYQGPSNTNCYAFGNSVNCTTTPGVSVAPIAYDTNDQARLETFRACMRGKGWIWRTK